MRKIIGAAVISLLTAGFAYGRLPVEQTLAFTGECLPEVTEYYLDFTGERVDLSTLDGEWWVVDVEDYIDLTLPEEPTFYKIYITPVPDTEGETPMIWYGMSGPFYFEELDDMFINHQLP